MFIQVTVVLEVQHEEETDKEAFEFFKKNVDYNQLSWENFAMRENGMYIDDHDVIKTEIVEH